MSRLQIYPLPIASLLFLYLLLGLSTLCLAEITEEVEAPPVFKPRTEPVNFLSEGDLLVGTLYLPKDASADKQAPIVIVVGGWASVKEQYPSTYATRLCEAGYATLAFDFRGFGGSQGQPRQYEAPERKVEDTRSAITFAKTRPELKKSALFLLGIDSGAGVAAAASTEKGVKALAIVAPWLHHVDFLNTLYGSRPTPSGKLGTPALRTWGENERLAYEADGKVAMIPAADTKNLQALFLGNPRSLDYYFNPERGAVPTFKNELTASSWETWLNFNGVETARKVKVPTFLVHSEDAAIPNGAQAFLKRLPKPAEEHWITARQTDFFDKKETLGEVLPKLLSFLERQ